MLKAYGEPSLIVSCILACFSFSDKIISIYMGSLIPKPFANEMQPSHVNQQKRRNKRTRCASLVRNKAEACLCQHALHARVRGVEGSASQELWEHLLPASLLIVPFTRAARCRQGTQIGGSLAKAPASKISVSWVAWLMMITRYGSKEVFVCEFEPSIPGVLRQFSESWPAIQFNGPFLRSRACGLSGKKHAWWIAPWAFNPDRGWRLPFAIGQTPLWNNPARAAALLTTHIARAVALPSWSEQSTKYHGGGVLGKN